VTIPAPRSGLLAPLYEGVRYENGRWPLWRWDKNLRYLAKSLLHRPTPWTYEDRDHFARARAYMRSGAFLCPGPARPRRVLAGGDLMWIRSGFGDALSPALRARVEAADLALVNLETPMVPERKVPRFVYETLHYNSPPAYLDAFRSARPRVVSLCNNHALDQGWDGLVRTREVIAGMGLCPLGGVLDSDAVTGVRVGDLSVGVTAVTFGINHLTGAPPAGVPVERFGDEAHLPNWPRMQAQIDAARRVGPDLVVLLAHWGFEYEYFPGALQRAHARRLIELGVDVIVGSSPHVLQPVEVVSVDGADPACPASARRGGSPRFALIAWSLGNLATIMPTLPCQVGALLEIDVVRDARGTPALSALRAVPTVSARRSGARFLDVETRELGELSARTDDAGALHARALLGALIEDPTRVSW
jgi:poly-gamma-glutamate capsule biosynthesis protein CapA/YwtB (metallophosphatase superfamily)